MARGIITLTTDFGHLDHFVGTMKGVIKSIAPGADIVDICHEVSAFDVTEGAFVLAQAYRYFPKNTIHVAVVDPGVGSERRAIVAQGAGQTFLAPDNGVLSLILEKEKCAVREITADRYFLKSVSQTFHGRDVFAPAAAHLAKGVPVSRLGKPVKDALRMALATVHRTGKRTWSGAILKIDRFGNLITSLPTADFPAISERLFELAVGLDKATLLVNSYSQAPMGELFVIAGSAGYLEVGIKQGSAANRLKVGCGAPVELTFW